MSFLSDAASAVGQVWTEVASSPDPNQTTITLGKNLVTIPPGMHVPNPIYAKQRLWSKNNQFPGIIRPDMYPVTGSGNVFFRGQADFVLTLRRDGSISARQIQTYVPSYYRAIPPTIPEAYANCMIRSLNQLGTHPALSWPANYPKSEIMCRVHCIAPQAGRLTYVPPN